MPNPNAEFYFDAGRFVPLLEATPDATIIINLQGIILLANVPAERAFGYSKEQLIGRPVEQLLPERFRSKHLMHRASFNCKPMARPMGAGHTELYGLRSDGSEFPLDISLNPLEIDQHQLIVAAIRDMTLRQLAEDRLRALSSQLNHSRAGLQAVLDSISEGVITFSLEGNLVNANLAALRMFGIQSGDDEFAALRALASDFHLARLDGTQLPFDQSPIARITHGETLMDVELELGRFNTGQRWIANYSGAPVLDPDTAKPIFGVCTVRDITERKQTEERTRQAALHDPLTGLPNRALLFEYSRQVFAQTKRRGHNAAVLFIDLDHFKPINDTYGHEVGDAVLQEVALRLKKGIRDEDIAFRLGGDEFLIILPDIQNGRHAGEVAQQVRQNLNLPYHVNGLKLSLSSSIGISIYPEHGDDIDTLIQLADSAMYHTKHTGRDGYHFYSSSLAARANAKSRIDSLLRLALLHGDFRLDYQPIIDMHSSRMTGVEALLRWPHEGIGPAAFVPVAETSGLIAPLGQWVVSEACRQHKTWIEHGLPPIPIAVNVSAVQFRQPDLVDQFAKAIQTYQVGTDALQLELTETALMEDLDYAIVQLSQMKSLGVRISLDDFGTGYSSLSYLSRLPIDKIKVDKSFVYRLENDAASRTITDAIIALGHALHLEIVAEGIESESVLQYLRTHGCNQAQGYHVCAPISADGVEAWFQARATAGTGARG